MKKNIHTLIGLCSLLIAAAACRKEAPRPLPPASPTARIMLLQPNPYLAPITGYSTFMDTVQFTPAPVAYPGMTQYASMPAGARYLLVTKAGTYGAYMFYPFFFKAGSSYTFYNIDNYAPAQGGSPALIEDDLTRPPAGYAKVRFIQDANFNRRLNCIVRNGDTLALGRGYRNQYPDTTAFKPVAPGNYLFDLSDYDAPHTFRASLQTTIEAGKCYTIFSMRLPVPDSISVSIGMQLITNQ